MVGGVAVLAALGVTQGVVAVTKADLADPARASAEAAELLPGLEVVPVAGHDSMLLNLSGAHGPFFTRNIAIVTDSEGREGLGEVPGGEAIRQTIADAAEILVGQPVARVPQQAGHDLRHRRTLRQRHVDPPVRCRDGHLD